MKTKRKVKSKKVSKNFSGETTLKQLPDNTYFNEWYEVTEIVVPNTFTKIGYLQFSGFDNITSITIPDSVTSIGYNAFEDCASLTIYCEAQSQQSGWDSRWNYSDRPVYWAGEWEYDVNGNPYPLI